MKLKDFCKWSPFEGNSISSDSLYDESFFRNHVLHISSEFKSNSDSILRNTIWGNAIEAPKRYFFLHGYSGNGKTTFLNWFKDYLVTSKLANVTILNFTERPNFDTEKKTKELKLYLFRQIDHKSEYINILKLIIEKRRNNQLDPTIITNKTNNALYEILNFIYNKTNENKEYDIINDAEYENKFIKLKLNIIIALTILYNICLKQEESKLNNPKFLIFDNLDVLELEFLTNEFMKSITEAISIVEQYYFNEQGRKNYFIGFVLRESNFAIISPHTKGRVKDKYFEIRFDQNVSYHNIITRRIKAYYSHNELNDLEQNSIDIIYDILTFMNKNHRFVREVYSPYVNFDIRRYFDILSEIAKEFLNWELSNSRYKYHTVFKSIDPESIGASGIMLNKIIAFNIDSTGSNRILENFKKNDTHCNISRQILTVLYNNCYPNGLDIDSLRSDEDFDSQLEKSVKRKPAKISIRNIVRSFQKYYNQNPVTNVQFLKSVYQLYRLKNSSSSHFLTIYGKKYKTSKISGVFTTDSFEEMYNSIGKESRLKNADLKINAAGVALIRSVLPHFEFFNIITCSKYSTNLNEFNRNILCQPLFLSVVTYSNSFIINSHKFNHEVILERVYLKVKQFKEVTEKQLGLKEMILDEKIEEINKFLETDLTMQVRNNKFLHLWRIVFSHLRYIDEFRIHLLECTEFKNNLQDLRNDFAAKSLVFKYPLNTEIEIFNVILEYEKKYIELLSLEPKTITFHPIIEKLSKDILNKINGIFDSNEHKLRVNI